MGIVLLMWGGVWGCLRGWADLEWCSVSQFRSLRLEVLLDKYFSKGAENAVCAYIVLITYGNLCFPSLFTSMHACIHFILEFTCISLPPATRDIHLNKYFSKGG